RTMQSGPQAPPQYRAGRGTSHRRRSLAHARRPRGCHRGGPGSRRGPRGRARRRCPVVFASGAHLAAPEAVLEGVHEALRPAQLVGCGASGVLAAGAEVEDGTAVAVWAAALADGAVTTFHASAPPDDTDQSSAAAAEPAGLPGLGGATGAIVFPDPYTFDTEALLATLR